MDDETDKTDPAPAPARPRLSALDSEFLRVDDRIVSVERAVAKTTEDMFLVRQVLIDQIVTIALLELALAAIVVAFIMINRREVLDGV